MSGKALTAGFASQTNGWRLAARWGRKTFSEKAGLMGQILIHNKLIPKAVTVAGSGRFARQAHESDRREGLLFLAFRAERKFTTDLNPCGLRF